jgi:cobalt-precorrin-5B (C1)-methyltransferase
MSKLRKGYTTGVHACIVFELALEAYLCTKKNSICKTNKMDNDDLDVTKGCEIIATISSNKSELNLNTIYQEPQIFTSKENKISIFAGVGVGIVTKKGLKIEPNFPAINPVPLNAMREIFEKLTVSEKNLKLYCSIGITNGETIAKQSANSKVGVLGGLSILGTTGIVKPVSSSAYIDSVETEINFANQNGYDVLVFTLGNSALKYAKQKYEDEQIIEIGNFVYDSLKIAKSLHVKSVLFICGIGKMTKVTQGFKNTHNRFGVIDFKLLKNKIKATLNVEVDTEKTLTVKGIVGQLEELNLLDKFYTMIEKSADKQLKLWYKNAQVKIIR